MSKLSTVKGLSSSPSPVVDPLLCVQREISVVLVIVVKFFLAARFLCGALLLYCLSANEGVVHGQRYC